MNSVFETTRQFVIHRGWVYAFAWGNIEEIKMPPKTIILVSKQFKTNGINNHRYYAVLIRGNRYMIRGIVLKKITT